MPRPPRLRGREADTPHHHHHHPPQTPALSLRGAGLPQGGHTTLGGGGHRRAHRRPHLPRGARPRPAALSRPPPPLPRSLLSAPAGGRRRGGGAAAAAAGRSPAAPLRSAAEPRGRGGSGARGCGHGAGERRQMLAEGRPLRRGSALGSASRAAAEALRGVGEADGAMRPSEE